MYHVSNFFFSESWIGLKADVDLNLLTERSNHCKVSRGIKWAQAIAPVGVIVCSMDRSLPPVEMHSTQSGM